MGIDISIESDTNQWYHLHQRLLFSLFMALDLYCSGDQDYQYLNVIEPFFDHQARRFLEPIVNAFYYAPDCDYTENDFDLYLRDNSPRGDGIAYSEEEFLKMVRDIKYMWRNIDEYIDAITRFIQAVDLLDSLNQDPIGRYGIPVLTELLETLDLAAKEGAQQIRLTFV